MVLFPGTNVSSIRQYCSYPSPPSVERGSIVSNSILVGIQFGPSELLSVSSRPLSEWARSERPIIRKEVLVNCVRLVSRDFDNRGIALLYVRRYEGIGTFANASHRSSLLALRTLEC